MSDENWREQLPPKVRTLQIIVGAMFMGCFIFLLIAVLVANTEKNATEQLLLTYIGLAFAALILPPWFILPGIIVTQGRKEINRRLSFTTEQVRDRSPDDKKEKENSEALAFMGLYQTKTIVACAMLEGAVFFLLIVYIAEHSLLAVLPAAALLILLLAQLPTIGRVTNWIENQMRLMDEERAFG